MLLVLIAAALASTTSREWKAAPTNRSDMIASVASVASGVVAAFVGAAGEELLIPTIVLLDGVYIKIAVTHLTPTRRSPPVKTLSCLRSCPPVTI